MFESTEKNDINIYIHISHALLESNGNRLVQYEPDRFASKAPYSFMCRIKIQSQKKKKKNTLFTNKTVF